MAACRSGIPGFTRNKVFYKTFFSLLAVVALQQLATFAVNMVDNIMLGRYAEAALSGATLVNQYQNILMNLTAGAGMGIVVLAGQYWGKGRTTEIKKIISLGVKLNLTVGIIFFVLGMTIPEQMLRLLTSDDAIIREGIRYIRILCFTYPVYTISSSLMYALQSVETVFIGTIMSLSTVCINFCLNSLLIYGRFGFPEMGVGGAAVATLISRCIELLIVLVYILKIDKKLQTKPMELIRTDFSFFGDYMKVSTPLMISGFFWGIAQTVQTAILGHMSAPAIAATSIATITFAVLSVVGMACANVSNVVISKEIGTNGLKNIREYSITMQLIFIVIGLISGTLIYLCRGLIIGIYSTGLSPEAKEITWQFLTVLAFTVPFSCYEYPVQSGIIAGGGDTKYPAIIENLFNWLWVLPMSALCAFVLHLSPTWVYLMLKSDQILKCIPNGIKCNRFRWARELTRQV